MQKYLIVILFIAIQLFGCKRQNCIVLSETKAEKKLTRLKRNICNGNRIVYNQEFSYDSTGKLIPNGHYYTFFDDGKAESIAFFRNGFQDSIAIKYNPNGNKEMEFYWKDGKMRGFQNWYLPNGIQRKYYVENSQLLFEVKYGKSGKIDSISGKIIYPVLNKGLNNYKVGDQLFIGNEVVKLSDAKTELSISLRTPSQKLIDTSTTKYYPMENIFWYPFMHNCREKGSYLYVAKAKIFRKDNNSLIKEDSVAISVNVK